MTSGEGSGPVAPLAPSTVIRDRVALEAFAPEWRAFAGRHATSPFAQPAWLLPWHRHYAGETGSADADAHREHAGGAARDGDARVLVWRSGGQLVGVAPLVERRRRLFGARELSFFGGFGPALRGMVDITVDDLHRPAVEAGWLAWLSSASWDVLNALRLPPGSTTAAGLTGAALASGWRTVSLVGVVGSTTYVIDLPADESGWAGALGPKARHNLRTEERRFSRAGGRYERVSDPDAADSAAAAIRHLTLARWGSQDVHFRADPAFGPFLADAFRDLLAEGSLFLDVARDPGGIRACLATMVLNRRAVALAIGVSPEPDVRSFSLGKHLFDASIGEAVRRGCLTYDFLWAGDYKHAFWHARPATLESLLIGRGARGVATAEVTRFRRRVLPSLIGRGPRQRLRTEPPGAASR